MVSYIFLLFILASINKPTWGQNRIIGGQNAKISDFPFMIYINAARGKSVCSGSIISDKWGLSAAHCFKKIGINFTISDYVVTSGDANKGRNSISSTRRAHKINQYYMHEKFHEHGRFGYDIAVFQVIEPFVFGPNTSPIRLPSNGKDATAPTARVAGWGCTKHFSNANDYLKYVWVQKYSEKECQKDYPNVEQKGSVLCYGTGKNTLGNPGNTCPGDSGGPLFTQNNIVIGITSLVQTSSIHKPSLYTNVLYYRKWIKSKTKI